MFKERRNWFHFCSRWAFCWLLAGGWENYSLAAHKLFAPGSLSIVIDTGYCFLLHCSMINAHLQQIWGLIKQNYVILQRKEDLIIYTGECLHTAGLKNFKLAFFLPLQNCMKFYAFSYRPILSNQNSLKKIYMRFKNRIYFLKINPLRKPHLCNRRSNQLHWINYFVSGCLLGCGFTLYSILSLFHITTLILSGRVPSFNFFSSFCSWFHMTVFHCCCVKKKIFSYLIYLGFVSK